KDKQDVRKESKVLTYPACVFTWPNLIVNRTTYTYGEGIIEKLPAEVKLIMIRNSDLNAYSRAIKTYSDPETIEGLGEGATWGNRLSQLTFFSTNHIFHVTVQVSDDLQTNKSVAI